MYERDVLGDDSEIDRHSELALRGSDQVAVGVGEEREPPPALAELGEGAGDLGERGPVRQRVGERACLALGELDLLVLREPLERERQHLVVAAERLGLELRLELVVALEQPRCVLDPEDALELASDPEVPVDQGAVAVECCPALLAAIVGH